MKNVKSNDSVLKGLIEEFLGRCDVILAAIAEIKEGMGHHEAGVEDRPLRSLMDVIQWVEATDPNVDDISEMVAVLSINPDDPNLPPDTPIRLFFDDWSNKVGLAINSSEPQVISQEDMVEVLSKYLPDQMYVIRRLDYNYLRLKAITNLRHSDDIADTIMEIVRVRALPNVLETPKTIWASDLTIESSITNKCYQATLSQVTKEDLNMSKTKPINGSLLGTIGTLSGSVFCTNMYALPDAPYESIKGILEAGYTMELLDRDESIMYTLEPDSLKTHLKDYSDVIPDEGDLDTVEVYATLHGTTLKHVSYSDGGACTLIVDGALHHVQFDSAGVIREHSSTDTQCVEDIIAYVLSSNSMNSSTTELILGNTLYTLKKTEE